MTYVIIDNIVIILVSLVCIMNIILGIMNLAILIYMLVQEYRIEREEKKDDKCDIK